MRRLCSCDVLLSHTVWLTALLRMYMYMDLELRINFRPLCALSGTCSKTSAGRVLRKRSTGQHRGTVSAHPVPGAARQVHARGLNH